MMGRKGAVGVGVMGLTFLFGFIGVASAADATTTTCAGDAAPAVATLAAASTEAAQRNSTQKV